MRSRALQVLLLLNLVLAAALASLWWDADGQLRNVRWIPPAAVRGQIAALPQLQPATADLAAATLAVAERPLFSPARRPPPPPPPPAPPPPPDPLQTLQVVGVAGTGASASILARLDGKVRRIASGESVGEWQLKSASDREVVFDRKGELRAFRLTAAPLTNAPGTAPVFRAPTPPMPPPSTAPSAATAPAAVAF